MKDKKLNQIFAAVRRETPPVVPDHFADRVQSAIAREGQTEPVVINLWDQLNRGFSRYAVAAAAMIVICAAVELTQHFGHQSTMDDDIEQIFSDWTMH